MGSKREVTREIDLDHMSLEERADMAEAHCDLRGTVIVMRGQIKRVEGRLARPNGLIVASSIRNELVALAEQTKAAIAALDRIAV